MIRHSPRGMKLDFAPHVGGTTTSTPRFVEGPSDGLCGRRRSTVVAGLVVVESAIASHPTSSLCSPTWQEEQHTANCSLSLSVQQAGVAKV